MALVSKIRGFLINFYFSFDIFGVSVTTTFALQPLRACLHSRAWRRMSVPSSFFLIAIGFADERALRKDNDKNNKIWPS
jgi:hypothetical protein